MFRDIHCFNLALLSKQVWRLVDSADSFCASILRPKYFPDGNLRNANLKKGASFTWQRQSIMAGVRTLKLGLIWRVGNGDSIDIWSPSRKILTRRVRHLLSKVSDLIDPATGNWNTQLIEQTFWRVDRQRILSFLLSANAAEDFVA